jgi:hypothetical protein
VRTGTVLRYLQTLVRTGTVLRYLQTLVPSCYLHRFKTFLESA